MAKQGKKIKNLSFSTDRSVLCIESRDSSNHIEDEIFTAEEAINGSGYLGVFQAKLIVFTGFIWMARGVDEVLVSFIGPLLSCDWKLERWQAAVIVTGSQLSSALGCILYGIWSDRYGRRAALSSTLIFFFVFGAVSSGLPSYTWYVIFRMVCAFAAGGLPQALVLVSEFTPGGKRGRAVFILSVFWAVGIIGMIALLYSASEPPQNWRTFVAISSLPACITMLLMKFFPESIRYLLISNQDTAANVIMEEMVEENKQNLPNGVLESAIDWKKRGRFGYLFRRSLLKSTLLFCFIGLGTAVSYSGLIIMSPAIMNEEIEQLNITNSERNFLGNVHTVVECLPNVTSTEFIEIMWTSALDFPGIFVYMILVDVINRKIFLGVSSAICSLFIFLQYIPTPDILVKTAFLYCSRALLIPQFDLILLMSSEAYPTTHRGCIVGLCVSTFYIGFFLSPYIYQAIGRQECLLGFYGCITLLCGIAGAFLPLETRGLELMEIPKEK
ncbi:synaptic vesicle 2-related protein-like isoform X2 [Parasteatoda tepidariorum]|uniref:synaptic vesicle 2-related protein-like isoform X2 n=1 Tax=Parasteatoda tepidariorum TaxID=114398 RepID=UPI001C71D951|nr:synaptic vesicle 2-related protein-like isoform X2 [Parasteatoda tepidariorum]